MPGIPRFHQFAVDPDICCSSEKDEVAVAVENGFVAIIEDELDVVDRIALVLSGKADRGFVLSDVEILGAVICVARTGVEEKPNLVAIATSIARMIEIEAKTSDLGGKFTENTKCLGWISCHLVDV